MTGLTLTLQPARAVRGVLQVPGDKSISHRYVLLGAMATGTTQVTGFAPGADVASTVSCLRTLGADITAHGAGRLRIRGPRPGDDALRVPTAVLDAGNSGTTLRLLAGILAGCPFHSTIGGDDSLQRRPMARIIEPLTAMGARITSRHQRAPLDIDGGSLQAIDWTSPVSSAQVKSAVCSRASRRRVERAFVNRGPHGIIRSELWVFGIELADEDGRLALQGGQRPTAPDAPLRVPGDASSAAVWAAAAAALPGSEVRIDGVGLNPGRVGFVHALERMGAKIDLEAASESAREPVGTMVVRHGPRQRAEIAADEVPGLIDELPALAASAALGGHLTVSGAGELRVKESDRITALVTGLRQLGVQADERPDGFVVDGSTPPSGGAADAAGDHRLVMAFAIVALGATGPTTVSGADVVGVSYPGFIDDLATLAKR